MLERERGERKRTILKRHTKRAAMAISSLLVNHHRRPSSTGTTGSGGVSGLSHGSGGGKRKRETLPIASSAKPWIPSVTTSSTTTPVGSFSKEGTETEENGTTTPVDHQGAPPVRYTQSPAVRKAEEAIAAAKAAQQTAKHTTSTGEAPASGKEGATAKKNTSPFSTTTSSPPPPSPPPPDGTSEKLPQPRAAQGFHKKYEEHRILGWSPEQVYRVVADVDRYSEFLPWCASSVVHGPLASPDPSSSAAVGSAATQGGGKNLSTDPPSSSSRQEVTATLMVGFSFFKEAYTSHVILEPPFRVVATLHMEQYAIGSSTSRSKKGGIHGEPGNTEETSSEHGGGGGFFSHMLRRAVGTVLHPPSLRGTKHGSSRSGTGAGGGAEASGSGRSGGSVLRQLRSEWVLKPVKHQPSCVEVDFYVAFEFRHPMYGALIMSNIVSLMTHSFERRCEALYGPPSRPSEAIR